MSPRRGAKDAPPQAAGADARCYGAQVDLAKIVDTHLFCLSPSHGGSTFVRQALATSAAIWAAPEEASWLLGGVRPALPFPAAFHGVGFRRQALLADDDGYDWPRTRRAWYFQAQARSPAASVFFSQSPRHLFQADLLAARFANAKFLFMVRNPYALCEALCRSFREKYPGHAAHLPLEEIAATHYVACFKRLGEVMARHSQRGAFFSYETMCDVPERVAALVGELVPAIDDLDFRQRLPVKDSYYEVLTNMNETHIGRLDEGQIAAMNSVFRPNAAVLGSFGYELM